MIALVGVAAKHGTLTFGDTGLGRVVMVTATNSAMSVASSNLKHLSFFRDALVGLQGLLHIANLATLSVGVKTLLNGSRKIPNYSVRNGVIERRQQEKQTRRSLRPWPEKAGRNYEPKWCWLTVESAHVVVKHILSFLLLSIQTAMAPLIVQPLVRGAETRSGRIFNVVGGQVLASLFYVGTAIWPRLGDMPARTRPSWN